MRWIIGDIHGMLRPLEALVSAIHRADPQATLLFAGDFVNRGPDSRRVVDLLLSLENARFIRGNHDDVFDQILHGSSYCENGSRHDPLTAFRWFMQHGMRETFISYGVSPAEMDALGQHPTRP